jgi:hypothetical protein
MKENRLQIQVFAKRTTNKARKEKKTQLKEKE